MKLEVGMTAPDFALADKDGIVRRLTDFRGQTVVVYFYPKDDTPGCTRQACAFRDSFAALRSLNAVVIGISKDSVESHARFAEKYALPFILCADPERTAQILRWEDHGKNIITAIGNRVQTNGEE